MVKQFQRTVIETEYENVWKLPGVGIIQSKDSPGEEAVLIGTAMTARRTVRYTMDTDKFKELADRNVISEELF